ncbi:competence type IV pilus assembly protein ComGB [Alkalibacterium sp. f15]|uniref:competence type IV pilus assembly protein ComGB n=1 Tax=Alkalibacterium sp. f15 TaxID=3414029 RepID=UPI003BF7D0E9
MAILPKKHTSVISFLTHKQTIRQGQFLKRCGRLLLDGFSLQEALLFLETIVDAKSKQMVQIIHKEVSQGTLFSEALKKAGFPDEVCAQLYFSLYHGQLAETAINAGSQLLKRAEKKKRIITLLHYPVILLFFVTLMLLAMRFILIPHISELTAVQDNQLDLGTRFIVAGVYHAPTILIVSGILCALSLKLLVYKGKTMTPLARLMWITRWSKSSLFQLYWSQFFSSEWGFLLKGNSSLFEVVTIMKQNTLSPLITEVGEYIEKEMKQGKSFHVSLQKLNFLKQEVMLVVKQGEQSGHLGQELEMYARSCEEEFDENIDQLMNWIQPMIFIFVAIIIVAIYAALLLPTFSALQTF